MMGDQDTAMSITEKTFTIQGMSCGGCVNSLTRVLKSVPGIEPLKIEVGKAQLRLDERVTSQAVRAPSNAPASR